MPSPVTAGRDGGGGGGGDFKRLGTLSSRLSYPIREAAAEAGGGGGSGGSPDPIVALPLPGLNSTLWSANP